MAIFSSETLARNEALVPALAKRLLADGIERLPSTTVIMPSTRAGASLAHALLGLCGSEAILLPEITTPSHLARDLGERLPALDHHPIADRIRSLILTNDLVQVEWLIDRPESAPGHAETLIKLFDDIRLAGRDPAQPLAGMDINDELLERDAVRVAEAWALYRRHIPCDSTDRIIDIVDAASIGNSWPGRPVQRLIVAGFVDLNPTWTRLLKAAADDAGEALLLLGGTTSDDSLLKRFLKTWPDAHDRGHPDAPDQRVRAALTECVEAVAKRDERPLVERLDEAGPLVDSSTPLLVPLNDPETESRTVTHRVMSELHSGQHQRIGIATNDRSLSRRIVAQLRDAGVDVDDSSGRPLASEPEGLLAWTLLRCAMTGPAHEPLLELLTHPMTTFGRERGPHRRRTLRFEKELLRGRTAGADLKGLHARAIEKDDDARKRRPEAKPEMQTLVEDITKALQPLLGLAQQSEVKPADMVAALRKSWNLAAPETELDHPEGHTDDRSLASRRALSGILDDLATQEATLPSVSLAGFAANLARLIRREDVRPHRAAFLPVQVTGLLEARLEAYDLLIMCGTTEDNLPGRQTRGLLLGDRWRDDAGLSGWRDVLGQQAELFTRLLRNAPEVMITWPREQNGQPVLPSPLVTRLMLAGVDESAAAPDIKVWQREPVPVKAQQAAQSLFAGEASPPKAAAQPHRPRHLSHSALKTWIECPYRFLLERGFGLREEDDVIDRMRRQDMGEIVHAILANFLGPKGEGFTLIRAGKTEAAEALLSELVTKEFTVKAGMLPQRRLWESSFRRTIPAIVALEIERASHWAPLAVETEFEIPLGVLANGFDDLTLTKDEAALTLKGRIDRVDVRMTGDGRREYAVLDYKTGHAPIQTDIKNGQDLQLALYAHAVGLGGVPELNQAGDVAAAAFYKVAPDSVKIDGPFYPDKADPERDRRRIVETSLAILRDTEYPYVPNFADERDPKPCRYCAQKDVCRRDERFLTQEVTP
jgi:ATP-dependent helicase/nuclease subunit B